MQNVQNNKANQRQNVSRETKMMQALALWDLCARAEDGYYTFAMRVKTNDNHFIYTVGKYAYFMMADLGVEMEEVILRSNYPIIDVYGCEVSTHPSVYSMVCDSYECEPLNDTIFDLVYNTDVVFVHPKRNRVRIFQ